MGDVFGRAEARTILLGHTSVGVDLAPRLAFPLKPAIATCREKIEADGERLRVTRRCSGKKV